MLRGDAVDPGSRNVRRREDADREALPGELVAALLGLRLERIVRELEIHGVLEDDCGAIADNDDGEVVEIDILFRHAEHILFGHCRNVLSKFLVIIFRQTLHQQVSDRAIDGVH